MGRARRYQELLKATLQEGGVGRVGGRYEKESLFQEVLHSTEAPLTGNPHSEEWGGIKKSGAAFFGLARLVPTRRVQSRSLR